MICVSFDSQNIGEQQVFKQFYKPTLYSKEGCLPSSLLTRKEARVKSSKTATVGSKV